MIRNIIFDVGNVLVEWAPEKAMRRLGMDEQTVQAVAGATVQTKDWDETDRGALSPAELLLHFIEKAPRYEKDIRTFWEHIDMAIYPFAYVQEWMERLKGKGYHLYILSNYGAWTYEKTKDDALSFLKYVDGALFSYEVCQIKPEPEIYHTLMERYGLKAEECFFLDDRQENVDGAEVCGIHAIRFTSYQAALQSLREYGIEC